MKFEELEINQLDLSDWKDFIKLINKYLCGEKRYRLSLKDQKLIKKIHEYIQTNEFNYEQFNEILLVLNQNRMSEHFFNKFFKKAESENTISLEALREGVQNFRGFAMLCFGNFRFAYKNLNQKKTNEELDNALKPFCNESEVCLNYFTNRPSKMLEIKRIDKEKIVYVGELFKAELRHIEDLISSNESEDKKLSEYKDKYDSKICEIINVQKDALRNTQIYLTWDYMDVYISTSMRNKWEFEQTFDLISEIFEKTTEIKNLNLRYYDPTQSYCANRIDKGLIEGLMLKRVICSIYMAQDSDTMGKDSELAATLAQGKPVIAYIPNIDLEEYTQKIEKYPLSYFEKRFLILQAEGILTDEKCVKALEQVDKAYDIIIQNFMTKLGAHEEIQLNFLEEEQEKFKLDNQNDFKIICKLLAIAEKYNFDKRALLLREIHPLAIQVNLENGVANGVLIVRNYKDCAKLLYNILTNNLEFTIKHNIDGYRNVTALEENISQSPFRVVTDSDKLTNSFWNFYEPKYLKKN